MARTSLLVAIAFAAAPDTADALGVTLTCPCAAGPQEVCYSVEGESGPGSIDIKCRAVFVPEEAENQCGYREEIPCAGGFTCDISGWELVPTGGSCDSLSTRFGCENAGGAFTNPVGDACCGTCDFS